jgi:outer membrane protein assembly factor BamB
MDEINEDMSDSDAVPGIGAEAIFHPAAPEDPCTRITGMRLIEARTNSAAAARVGATMLKWPPRRRLLTPKELPTMIRSAVLVMFALASAHTGWSESPAGGQILWPGKTGPLSNGNVPTDWAASLPTEWDLASDRNIAWTASLRLPGHSTPVIGDGRIWFTSATDDGTEQYVDCFRLADGERLHHKKLFHNPEPESLENPINNYAAPTPLLAPDALYVHFGTYGTARLDPDTADVIWQRRDINVRHYRGPGSSPVLFENLLILTFDGIDKQFLIALNTETGETVWKTPRTTDYGDLDASGKPLREGDLRKAYGTPALAEVAGRTQVISVGSRAAFGYDARTGEEIWTITHDDYNAAAQPLIYDDTAILHTGSRGANLLAVKLDASTRGDVTNSHVVWDRPRGNSRLSFPVLVDHLVVWITDTGVATAVDARTGEQRWAKRIGGDYLASPLVHGRRIYFFSRDGESFVGDVTADELREIAENHVGDGVTASPAATASSLIVRTQTQLLKIGR